MPSSTISLGLGIGGGTSATSSGSLPLASDKVLLTEADDFLMTENDENIEFEE